MKGVNNMNNWTVYMHLNKVNKKYYFGITKQALERRFRNGEGYVRCPHFYHAIQKYGWENFDHIVIKENITESQAIWWEKYLIKKYDATNPDKGYNISTGGDVVVGSEKISQLNRQRWKQGVYDNICNPVYCIELDKQYNSALEAERQLCIDNSAIQKACRGKNNYAGIKEGQPLHWCFVKDISSDIIDTLKNRKEILKGINIPLYCPELNEYFNSTTDVYNKYGIDPSSIRKVIRGVNKSAGRHPSSNIPLHWIELKERVNVGKFDDDK